MKKHERTQTNLSKNILNWILSSISEIEIKKIKLKDLLYLSYQVLINEKLLRNWIELDFFLF